MTDQTQTLPPKAASGASRDVVLKVEHLSLDFHLRSHNPACRRRQC